MFDRAPTKSHTVADRRAHAEKSHNITRSKYKKQNNALYTTSQRGPSLVSLNIAQKAQPHDNMNEEIKRDNQESREEGKRGSVPRSARGRRGWSDWTGAEGAAVQGWLKREKAANKTALRSIVPVAPTSRKASLDAQHEGNSTQAQSPVSTMRRGHECCELGLIKLRCACRRRIGGIVQSRSG